MSCSACHRDCTATFICGLCEQEKNVCLSRIGGFEAKKNICVTCFEEKNLPYQFVFLMRLKDSEEVKRQKWKEAKLKQKRERWKSASKRYRETHKDPKATTGDV